MNEQPKYEVFISYRRDGGVDYARMIYLELKGRGYNTFFDYNSLRDGKFNEGIFKAIDECQYFILVLSVGSLDRCLSEDDWVRHEIEYALSKGKAIIPVCPSGSVRGFPEKMPASFEPLRNLQISMLQMDDLFEKSFDKIVEDRFAAEFREGRSPITTAGGVTSKIFKRIGIGVIVAIVIAATAITLAIVRGDKNVANEKGQSSAVKTLKRGSKEFVLSEEWDRKWVDCRMRIRKAEKAGVSSSDIAKVRALIDQGLEYHSVGKYAQAVAKANDAVKALDALADYNSEKILEDIDQQLANSKLTGDRKLRKKLELLHKACSDCPTNQRVLREKAQLEDILYPRLKLVARYHGKEVPVKYSLDINTIVQRECDSCGKKAWSGQNPWGRKCAKCRFCEGAKERIEVCHEVYSEEWHSHYAPLFVPGTKIDSAKFGQIYAQKGDAIGVITAEYSNETDSAVGRTDKIVVNWIGVTNIVVEMEESQKK